MLPIAAYADRHKIGARGAVARADRSNLWGIQFSTDFTLYGAQKDRYKEPKLGTLSAVFEGSLVHGTHEREELSQATLLIGPRYSFNRVAGSRVQPYAQALVGRAWERQRGIQRSLTAFALGGGLYFPLGPTSAGDHAPLGVSVQYDHYGLSADPADWYPQITVGIVLRVESFH
jgi:hypothetical protein